jgi:hypothetical protein
MPAPSSGRATTVARPFPVAPPQRTSDAELVALHGPDGPAVVGASVLARRHGSGDGSLRPRSHGPAVIVGHSGAGPLLPLIASTVVPPPWQLVFVDAGLPPIRGDATVVPDQFLGALRALAHDGVLPKWSEWFGPTAMEELISNEERRAAIVAELREVPLSYFAAAVPLPGRWSSATIGAFFC